MKPLFFLILARVLVLAVAAASRGRRQRGTNFAYARRQLMTEREVGFFHKLKRSLPQSHLFAQVSMSAIVDVKRGGLAARGRFSQKYVDFVVCSPNCRVLYVIELDDKSHNSAAAQKADAVKNEILLAAGIPIKRYSSVKVDEATLARDFQEAITAVAAGAGGAKQRQPSAEKPAGVRIDGA